MWELEPFFVPILVKYVGQWEDVDVAVRLQFCHQTLLLHVVRLPPNPDVVAAGVNIVVVVDFGHFEVVVFEC